MQIRNTIGCFLSLLKWNLHLKKCIIFITIIIFSSFPNSRYFFCMVPGNLESITVPFQLNVPRTFKNQLFLIGLVVQNHNKTSKYINNFSSILSFVCKQNNYNRFKTCDLVYLCFVSFYFKLWSSVVTTMVGFCFGFNYSLHL